MNSSMTLDEIALRTFNEDMDGEIDSEKEERWFAHWFQSSENYRQALIEKGLTVTADYVNQLIIERQKIVNSNN